MYGCMKREEKERERNLSTEGVYHISCHVIKHQTMERPRQRLLRIRANLAYSIRDSSPRDHAHLSRV